MMHIVSSLLVLLVSARPPAAWADVAPMPGSPEWEMSMREESKLCEPGEEMVMCLPSDGFPGRSVDPKSPYSCDRRRSDPDSYFLSALERERRYCKSAPDLPQACRSGDAEVRCDTDCAYDRGFPFAQNCASGLPACDSYLHSDKYYRIRKVDGSKLFYCGPDRKRTAQMRRLSAEWGKTLADCLKQNSKSAPQAISCGAGETELFCQGDWPTDPDSCAQYQGKRGYYDLPRASGSSVPGSPVKHVYCELSPEEAARREAGFQKCLDEALKKRRQGQNSL